LLEVARLVFGVFREHGHHLISLVAIRYVAIIPRGPHGLLAVIAQNISGPHVTILQLNETGNLKHPLLDEPSTDARDRRHSLRVGGRATPLLDSISQSDLNELEGERMDEGTPISYRGGPVGTPLLSSTDTQFGTVEHVLWIPELDIFDGIAIKTKHGVLFVDPEQNTEIPTTLIRCTLTDEQAAALPPPEGTLVLHPDLARDEGPSLTARYGRLFGRQHWKELE
jgi:hypothetical protein